MQQIALWRVFVDAALFFVCVALDASVLSNVLFIPEHSDLIPSKSVLNGNE